MKALKIVVVWASVIVVCVSLGYQTAIRTADWGVYACEDVKCPVIVMLVSGPLMSAGYLLVAGLVFFVWRRTRR